MRQLAKMSENKADLSKYLSELSMTKATRPSGERPFSFSAPAIFAMRRDTCAYERCRPDAASTVQMLLGDCCAARRIDAVTLNRLEGELNPSSACLELSPPMVSWGNGQNWMDSKG